MNIMAKPLISIIIPVYNVEPYLKRCIDSILSQNNNSWEAIIVDDGSTDGSSVICDEYARIDDRIHVYHKENGGVSSARNLGLDNAQGEWVVFVDSDDEITPDYLTIPQKYIDSDVLQKGTINRYGDGSEEIYMQHDDFLEGQDAVCRFFIQKRTMALWNKFIKRSIIGDTRFCLNIPIGEDGLFFFSIVSKVQKLGFSNIGQYIYKIRAGSAMSKYDIYQRNNIRFALCKEARRIAIDQNILVLYNNFVSDQYIPTFWRTHSYFTKDHEKMYFDLIDEVKVITLRYLTKRHLIRHLIILCKSCLYRVGI